MIPMNRLSMFLALIYLLSACQVSDPSANETYSKLSGQTMGTTYSVIYLDAQGRDFQAAIDSSLVVLNAEVSTYIPSSTISQYNQSEKGIQVGYNPIGEGEYPNIHFLQNLSIGLKIAQQTEGAFEPTVMPIVNYWGFGYTPKRAVTQVDSFRVDSLMRFIGLQHIEITQDSILKDEKGIQLDFSAIAKGYGVDLIADLLSSQGIENYFVEIGGEVRALGQSPRGDYWRVGISVPKTDAPNGEFAATAPLNNQAIATSGNYRNYYDVEGEKYGHTMNPKSGFPEKNNLLSASVFAKDCVTADAYATAFMVMGPENAFIKAEALEQLEAYFIVGKEDGSMETLFTSGLAPLFGN